jgi:uncharacterized protein (TIGR02246 family)
MLPLSSELDGDQPTRIGTMSQRAKILGWILIAATLPAYAALPSAKDAAANDIKEVLAKQAEAWNLGDVETFMTGYKDAPDTTFIGKSVTQGYSTVLDHYKKTYSSKEAMGTLEFSDLEVRSLDVEYAVVTGKFHLTRSAAGGGDASGIFSLVWEHTDSGWKIILDHTSATP